MLDRDDCKVFFALVCRYTKSLVPKTPVPASQLNKMVGHDAKAGPMHKELACIGLEEWMTSPSVWEKPSYPSHHSDSSHQPTFKRCNLGGSQLIRFAHKFASVRKYCSPFHTTIFISKLNRKTEMRILCEKF